MSDPAVATSAGAVVLEDVVKHFKSGPDIVRAVDGVSVAIPRGELVALKGPSGCGKSTLLNLLGALDRPDSGSIIVDGADITGLSGAAEAAYRRDNVGFVFQMFNLMPYLSAIENVTLPMELRGKLNAQSRRTLATSLLERVKLAPDRHRRRPARLSGGEQQRVAIARALANDPPLILADEPTANLDSTTGEQIVRLLRSLASGDRTVLIATHDTAIARQADLVITMRDGKLVGRDGGSPGG